MSFGGNRLEQGIHTCGPLELIKCKDTDFTKKFDQAQFVDGKYKVTSHVVENAVNAAQTAYSSFKHKPTFEIKQLLIALAECFVRENSMFTQSNKIEAKDRCMAVGIYRYFANWNICDQISGVNSNGGTALNFYCDSHSSVGIIAGVISWKYPLSTMAQIIGAALRCGNCVVIKVSQGQGRQLAQMSHALQVAKIPNGVVNLISGHGPVIGAELVRNPKIKKVVYNGSVHSATFIAEMCQLARPLKGLSLGLNYKSPALILHDANLDYTVSLLAASLWASTFATSLQPQQQQQLAAMSYYLDEAGSTETLIIDRVYVATTVWEPLLEKLKNMIEANPLGEFSTAPIEEYLNTSSGEPTANNAAIATSATLESGVNAWRYARVQEKCLKYIERAISNGAELLAFCSVGNEGDVNTSHCNFPAILLSDYPCCGKRDYIDIAGNGSEENTGVSPSFASSMQPPADSPTRRRRSNIGATSSGLLTPSGNTATLTASILAAARGGSNVSNNGSEGSKCQQDLQNCSTATNYSGTVNSDKNIEEYPSSGPVPMPSSPSRGTSTSSAPGLQGNNTVGTTSLVESDEIYGPVLHLYRCDSTIQQVQLINQQHQVFKNCYNVIFGKDLQDVHAVAQELRATIILHNDIEAATTSGIKDSAVLDFFTERKTISMRTTSSRYGRSAIIEA